MTASDRSFCARAYGTCARVGAACDKRRFRRARCGLRRVVRGIGRIDVDGSGANERSSGTVPEAISSPRRARRGDRHVSMSHMSVHRASARQWNIASAWTYGLRTLAAASNRFARLAVRCSRTVQQNNSNCPNSRLKIQRAWFWRVSQDSDESLTNKLHCG